MSDEVGRILAIDLGTVRIGLAMSDRIGFAAHPIGAMKRSGAGRDLAEIRRLVEEHEITRAVVGLPLLMSGEEGRAAEAARSFAKKLKAKLTGIEVELWDERLTTVEANRMLADAEVKPRRRKQVVDSLAAVLILESYLEARKREDGPDR